jgi:Fe-S-cluster containining protein
MDLTVTISEDQRKLMVQQIQALVDDIAAALPPEEALLAVHDAMSQIVAAGSRGVEAACHAGCSHCCHQVVTINYWELPAILKALEAVEPARRKRYVAQLRKAGSENLELRIKRGMSKGNRCPFLERDGTCGIYEGRPLSCRFYMSASEDACRRKLADNRHQVQGIAAPWLAKELVEPVLRMAMTRHYGAVGMEQFEMVTAVLSALDELAGSAAP